MLCVFIEWLAKFYRIPAILRTTIYLICVSLIISNAEYIYLCEFLPSLICCCCSCCCHCSMRTMMMWLSRRDDRQTDVAVGEDTDTTEDNEIHQDSMNLPAKDQLPKFNLWMISAIIPFGILFLMVSGFQTGKIHIYKFTSINTLYISIYIHYTQIHVYIY